MSVLAWIQEWASGNYNPILYHKMQGQDSDSAYMVPIKEKWAYCYRAGEGINTNMFVESLHKNFKYNYLHGMGKQTNASTIY